MTQSFHDSRVVDAGLLRRLFSQDVPDTVEHSLVKVVRGQPLQLPAELDQEVGLVLILGDQMATSK